MQLRSGDIIGGYRIEREVGQGGMGAVYLAEHERLRRPVALKVVAAALADDPGFRERFEREARLAARLDHPNVVGVYDAGVHEAGPWLAMRFVDGEDLSARMRAVGGPMPPAEAVAIVEQIASALDHAHAAGIVHRDVKPANVLLTAPSGMHVPPGGRELALLADFGLTKEVEAAEELTATGVVVGSIDYLAPERIEHGHVDGRADQYALATMLYTMLVGSPPFTGSTATRLFAHVSAPRPRPGDAIPALAAFDEVIARGMATNPAGRYASAGDLGRAARAALEGRRADVTEMVVARGAAAPSPVDDDGSGIVLRRRRRREQAAADAAGATAPSPVDPGAGSVAPPGHVGATASSASAPYPGDPAVGDATRIDATSQPWPGPASVPGATAHTQVAPVRAAGPVGPAGPGGGGSGGAGRPPSRVPWVVVAIVVVALAAGGAAYAVVGGGSGSDPTTVTNAGGVTTGADGRTTVVAGTDTTGGTGTDTTGGAGTDTTGGTGTDTTGGAGTDTTGGVGTDTTGGTSTTDAVAARRKVARSMRTLLQRSENGRRIAGTNPSQALANRRRVLTSLSNLAPANAAQRRAIDVFRQALDASIQANETRRNLGNAAAAPYDRRATERKQRFCELWAGSSRFEADTGKRCDPDRI